MIVFRSWILSLTGASILVAAAERLTPPGGVKRVTCFVCSVMLAGVMLRPILTLDREELALALREYHSLAAELTEDWEAKENDLIRPYIQEKCRAYILNVAQTLGLDDFDCTVRLRWRNESWVPYEITMTGTASAMEKKMITERLDAELGVPPERQFWDAER